VVVGGEEVMFIKPTTVPSVTTTTMTRSGTFNDVPSMMIVVVVVVVVMVIVVVLQADKDGGLP